MGAFAVLTNDSTAPGNLNQKRTNLYAQFVSRLTGAHRVCAEAGDLSAKLNQLVEQGLVYFSACADGVFDVYYGPSSEASSFMSDTVPYWPDNLTAKIKKTVRESCGVICTLQVENHTDSIQVFVTDWSSCTAACAIAIHHYHPFARRLENRNTQGDYFTGHYVRHPLTGDLMSVWVAEWVKPDFGTGAVLVNPAHNATDLRFARCVGLPIRFALTLEAIPDEYTSPQPPILKNGYAVRAGFLDGKQASSAHSETINVLLRKGVAHMHSDTRIPGEVIARVRTLPGSDSQKCFWNRHQGLLSVDPLAGVAAEVDFLPCFKTAVTAVTQKPDHIQITVGDFKKSMGTLGALIFDLGGIDYFTPLTVLESVEYAGPLQEEPILNLALLVGEAPEKVLVIKKSLLDQIESFLRSTKQLCQKLSTGGTQPPAAIKSLLDRSDPVAAFKVLHKWQKLASTTNEPVDRCAYLELLELLGLHHP